MNGLTTSRLTIHQETLDDVRIGHYDHRWTATARDREGNLATLDESTLRVMLAKLERERAPHLNQASTHVEHELGGEA